MGIVDAYCIEAVLDFPERLSFEAGCIDGVDSATEYVPQVEIFTRNRVPWIAPMEAAKPELADFTN